MSDARLFQETEGSSIIEEDALKSLQLFCKDHKKLEEDIEQKEKELKELKEKLMDLSRSKIPALLNSYSLSEIKLSTGEKIEVSDKIKANIKKDDIYFAYKDMIAQEGGDEEAKKKIDSLFKKELFIIGDSEDLPEEFMNYLLENDIEYDKKFSIHSQTLNKYCREKLSRGESIPEIISVFEYQETKIK